MVLEKGFDPGERLLGCEDESAREHAAEQDADGSADDLGQGAFPRGFRIGQGLAGEDGGAGFFVDVDDVGHLLSLSPGGMIRNRRE